MPLPPGAIPLRPDPQALHDRNVTAVVRAAIVNARVVSDPRFSAADLGSGRNGIAPGGSGMPLG
jgi:hypothetical protein